MNLLDLIFPKRCLECGKIGTYFCDRHRATIKTIEVNETICPVCEKPAIDGRTHPYCQTKYTVNGLTCFFHYDGIIRKAIKAIKYRRVSDLASEFVSLIPDFSFFTFSKLLITKPLNTFLIPIPLHPSRFRDRGFNQAEVLGGIIGRKLDIPVQNNILKRIKYTRPQVEVRNRDERLENMKNVFRIDSSTMNHELMTYLLFDDVFTTGATLRSAANVLKRGGAKKVWGITMAR